MILQRTTEGSEAILKNVEPGRYAKALFLGVWLCFWVAGEGFALWMLGGGLWAWLTGVPSDAGREIIDTDGGIPVMLFLLIWLTLWTFGGIMAGREFLRAIFGRDRIRVTPDGLEVTRSFGIFHTRRRLDRASVLRFRTGTKGGVLCADTPRGTRELTSYGTYEERSALAQELQDQFGLAGSHLPDSALPASLAQAVSPEGEDIVIKDPAMRQRQATVVWVMATPVILAAIYLAAISFDRPVYWGLAGICGAVGAALTVGGVWLSFGRMEWVIHTSRLSVQRRFGATRKMRFDGVALELSEDRAGRNGTAFFLRAVVAGGEPSDPAEWRRRKTLYSDASDASGPRQLGVWLSERCRIPFEDLTTPQAREKQMEELQSRLTGSGVVGETVLKLITRFGPESQQRNADQTNEK